MLGYHRMHTRIPRHTAAWLAYLFLVIPKTFVFAAGTLREEAASYRQQGYDAQQRGDQTTALSLYQKAAALDPAYPTPLNDMGILLEREGRLQEAEQAYQQALAVNPEYVEAHANLAMLYERLGDKEKAIYYWMKRYELGQPSDAGTLRAEERLLALGILKSHPGLKGGLYSRQRVAAQEFESHLQSMKEFHQVTGAHGDWPAQ